MAQFGGDFIAWHHLVVALWRGINRRWPYCVASCSGSIIGLGQYLAMALCNDQPINSAPWLIEEPLQLIAIPL